MYFAAEILRRWWKDWRDQQPFVQGEQVSRPYDTASPYRITIKDNFNVKKT